MVLDILMGLDAWLAQTFDAWGVVGEVSRMVFRFAVVVAVFAAWAFVVKEVGKRTFFGPHHMEPTLGSFAGRLLQVFVLTVGLVAGLAVLEVDLFAMATSLGLVGLGLAFGMQNTIANIVAGISMAMDRPFTIGDRIQVGDHWGEVEEIGLRSVRILTVRREYVIIPNRILDEQEIWNYTIRHPELRVDIPFSISYESDLDLADSIALDAARNHPLVLGFPKPRVLVRGFGDHGLEMELWTYVRNARDRYVMASDVLEAIKKRFDAEGVEIPYARQVNLEYDELPERGRLPAPPDEIEPEARPTALVVSAGEQPARQKARTVVRLAEDLGARLLVLHVARRMTESTQQLGEYAVRPFLEAAGRQGVDAEPMVVAGDLEDVVGQVVQAEDVDVLLVGATRKLLRSWSRGGVTDRLRRRLGIPIVTIDQDLVVDEAELERARQLLQEKYWAKEGTGAGGNAGGEGGGVGPEPPGA